MFFYFKLVASMMVADTANFTGPAHEVAHFKDEAHESVLVI